MKKNFPLAVFLTVLICPFSFGQSSLTDLLTKQFHQAWNKENINEMVSQLQHDAFFKSTNQLRYERDKMAATILKTKPPKYKVVSTKELHSKV